MEIEYGPPGVRGVSQIMGLNGEDGPVETISQMSERSLGWAALATLGLGIILGDKTIRNAGAGATAMYYLMRATK